MRPACLLAAAFLAAANALAQPPPAGEERFRQLMEQARARAAGAQAAGAAVPDERLRERVALLRKGEDALAALDLEAALAAFDEASSILHAADTELGLVRAYLQGGEYRRALAFVAHTAGAHRDAAGGPALYAWLLHLGGQRAAARRLLEETGERMPRNALIEAVSRELASPSPAAHGPLLEVPARLAPYAAAAALPAGSRVAGTGVLVDGGRRALAPAATVGAARTVWLRNGVGSMSRAVVSRRLPGVDVVELRVERPIAASVEFASRDPFPGSPGITVEFAPSRAATPGWPLLTVGFVGMPLAQSPYFRLGIDLPAGPRGGPVLDASGRLVGLSLPAPGGDRLVPLSRLMPALGVRPTPGSLQSLPRAALPVDQVYEIALLASVQVLVHR